MDNLNEAIESRIWCGAGPFTKLCESFLQDKLGVARALLTTSCTHALEMAAMLLELKPGDEVICPSFTFVSTASAFALHGAKIVFADVHRETLNIDERQVEKLITPKTRAIVIVHYGGVACNLTELVKLAQKHGVMLIEDNAHGVSSSYRGKPLGTFGALSTLSFHDTKNFTCGEGGALLINDPRLVERAEILREKGTDRSKFLRGQVDKYSWVDLGSSYVMSDLLAAMLYGQFQNWDNVVAARAKIWQKYHTGLKRWASEYGFGQPNVPPESGNGYHLYYLIAPTPEVRTQLIGYLGQHGILSVFHYVPLHDSRMGRALGRGDCPVTVEMSERLLRLPLFATMTDAQFKLVADCLENFGQTYLRQSKKVA